MDPGTARLAFAHVEWNGMDPTEEKNYAVHWACVVNLSADATAAKGDEAMDDREEEEERKSRSPRYAGMENQFENLEYFLEKSKTLGDILSERERERRENGKSLEVVIEQTEGVKDFNVLLQLMRVNMVSGWLYCYFKSKGVGVNFVPKTFKFGWSSLNGIVKRKIKENYPHKKGGGRKGSEKDLKRSLRKKAVCHLARYVSDNGFSSESCKKDVASCKSYEKMNHFSDAVAQAMRFVADRHAKRFFENVEKAGGWENNSSSSRGNSKSRKGKPKGSLNGTILSKDALYYVESSL